jgi:IrrE N-terminal-like domain
MRRGFKAFTERRSQEARKGLGLRVHAPIDARRFASAHGFIVWGPEDVPKLDPTHVTQLLKTDPDSWSGMTVRVGPTSVIVVNTSHPIGRQSNTIMHEWAHVELAHKPSRVDDFGNGLLLLSDYPKGDEEEADWLAGAMLLPREALLRARFAGSSAMQIATDFGVSEELVVWRLRMTGVNRQTQGRSASYAPS